MRHESPDLLLRTAPNRCLVGGVACFVSLILAVATTFGAQRVTSLDAQVAEGSDVKITADAVEITVGDKKQSMPRADVAEVILNKSPDVLAVRGQAILQPSAGGAIAITSLAVTGTVVAFDSALLGHVEMPIEAVRGVLLPDGTLTPAMVIQRCEELKVAGGARDLLVVAKTDKDWLTVEGVLKGLAGDTVTFNWSDQDRTLSARTVRAIVLPVAKVEKTAIAGKLVATDGSTLVFSSITMDEKSAKVELPGLGARSIPCELVAAVRLSSDRVVNIEDLKPISAKEHGFFETTFNYRTNRAVSGKELRLGGEAYPTGLGLHSYCELTYKIDGAYGQLVALVGIDDAVRPAGNASLTFIGDGVELDKPLAVTGKDDPRIVRVNLKGVKQLVIRVDFGNDKLDVADHVDLVAAKLIK